ncbi:MAG: pyridoxine 5'-phosphate synthase [Brevinema sp.]
MKNSKRLGVNIDHVATIRQARGTSYPEPLQAAYFVQNAGAHSLTIHTREDKRHIQKRDAYLIHEACSLPLNLEMGLTDEMMAMALDLCPEELCLVPEKREELTTEGGLDLHRNEDKLRLFIPDAIERGIEVSLFIDPVPEHITMASQLGAQAVELHTGAYAEATGSQQLEILEQIVACAAHADKLGLIVNAGHGLSYSNTRAIADIPEIRTLNIGHSIVARAIFVGLDQAVRDMLELIK